MSTPVAPAGRLSLTVSMLFEKGAVAAGGAATGLHEKVASFFDDIAELDPVQFDACRVEALGGFAPRVRLSIAAPIAWQAEDWQLSADAGLVADAPCRAFAYTFPNGRCVLSASFDIGYACGLREHLALCALQDALLRAALEKLFNVIFYIVEMF